jgi:hypothetical protein
LGTLILYAQLEYIRIVTFTWFHLVSFAYTPIGVKARDNLGCPSNDNKGTGCVPKELNRTVDVKVKVCIYARSEITFTEDSLDPTSNMREAKHCTCVLTEEEMETAHQNGIDIICIVGAQRCPFERRISVSRSTPSSRLLGKLKFDSPMHSFQELKRNPRKGMNRDGLGV